MNILASRKIIKQNKTKIKPKNYAGYSCQGEADINMVIRKQVSCYAKRIEIQEEKSKVGSEDWDKEDPRLLQQKIDIQQKS